MKQPNGRQVLKELTGPAPTSSRLPLHDGNRVAVIGGGPAGSFFTFFLMRLAEAMGKRLEVDIYEPRSFDTLGPGGCNHCGGVVSESLVQILATEGISLPPEVIRSAIDSYVIHMDVGSVRLEYLAEEGRIAALHRGNGPRGLNGSPAGSFDQHLLKLALKNGARQVKRLVANIDYVDGLPSIVTTDGTRTDGYHLVAVAAGINSNLVPVLLKQPGPGKAKTYISEFQADPEEIKESLGNSMHVFLLDLPRLEFAAIIPKGQNITLAILGDDIDDELIQAFLASPEVDRVMPDSARPVCNCSPYINVAGINPPYADRMVYIGDAGVTRLYKDGIGAAFRTSKSAADVAALVGVAEEDFRAHYHPVCKAIEGDNTIGKVIFGGSAVFKKLRFLRRTVLSMTRREQAKYTPNRPMSMVLWNMFTGSAPYRAIMAQAMRPSFIRGFSLQLVAANLFSRPSVSENGDQP